MAFPARDNCVGSAERREGHAGSPPDDGPGATAYHQGRSKRKGCSLRFGRTRVRSQRTRRAILRAAFAPGEGRISACDGSSGSGSGTTSLFPSVWLRTSAAVTTAMYGCVMDDCEYSSGAKRALRTETPSVSRLRKHPLCGRGRPSLVSTWSSRIERHRSS